MSLRDLDPTLREAACVAYLLARMGVPAAWVTHVVAPVKNARTALLYERTRDLEPCLHVRVVDDAGHEFVGAVGPMPGGMDEAAGEVAWRSLQAALEMAGAVELDELFRGSRAESFTRHIEVTLRRKGLLRGALRAARVESFTTDDFKGRFS